jgi:hypothetical protein
LQLAECAACTAHHPNVRRNPEKNKGKLSKKGIQNRGEIQK